MRQARNYRIQFDKKGIARVRKYIEKDDLDGILQDEKIQNAIGARHRLEINLIPRSSSLNPVIPDGDDRLIEMLKSDKFIHFCMSSMARLYNNELIEVKFIPFKEYDKSAADKESSVLKLEDGVLCLRKEESITCF